MCEAGDAMAALRRMMVAFVEAADAARSVDMLMRAKDPQVIELLRDAKFSAAEEEFAKVLRQMEVVTEVYLGEIKKLRRTIQAVQFELRGGAGS